MTEEQFEWFMIVGGMCADGLKWVEAMALCRNTMEMPDDIYEWMLERKRAIAEKKKKEQVRQSEINSREVLFRQSTFGTRKTGVDSLCQKL